MGKLESSSKGEASCYIFAHLDLSIVFYKCFWLGLELELHLPSCLTVVARARTVAISSILSVVARARTIATYILHLVCLWWLELGLWLILHFVCGG